MSTSPENTCEEIVTEDTIPLLENDEHQSSALKISTTTHEAPCAKYWKEAEESVKTSTTQNTKKAMRKLMVASVMSVLFLIVEIVGM